MTLDRLQNQMDPGYNFAINFFTALLNMTLSHLLFFPKHLLFFSDYLKYYIHCLPHSCYITSHLILLYFQILNYLMTVQTVNTCHILLFTSN